MGRFALTRARASSIAAGWAEVEVLRQLGQLLLGSDAGAVDAREVVQRGQRGVHLWDSGEGLYAARHAF